MLDYYLTERFSMIRLRGAVGVIGLLVLISMSAPIYQVGVSAQVPSTAIEALDERGRENRKRIEQIEQSENQLERRLIRIEAELEQIRKQSESAGQLTTGLLVGIGLILFERAMVLVFSIAKKGKST